jgi:hypothetical protein
MDRERTGEAVEMMNHGKICGVLCVIALLATLNPGGAHADDSKHYRLKRRVIRVELDSNPLVRVQCTLRDVRGVSETMVWDPAERRGLTRYALLPPRPAPPDKNASDPPDVLKCVSDRLDLPDTGGSFAYIFRSTEDCESKAILADPPKVTGCWKSVTGASDPKVTLTVTTSEVKKAEEVKAVLEQLGGFEQTTNLRSLDPTTMLVNDLLGTLATIALDRASEAGKQYVRSFLQDTLCERLTFSEVRKALPKTSELRKELERLEWPPDRRLLQTTCALIDTARIDELVSARDAVWRAVAFDATVLAGAILEGAIRDLNVATSEGQEVDRMLENIVRSLGDLMRSMISGNMATTERDVQVLILALGRVGLDNGPDSAKWRCGLEFGIAVLRDCLRDQSCFADELQRLLEQEGHLPEVSDKVPESNTCKVGEALAAWPELPTLLGRVADVLRPAPGVDARLTAATAFELVLDVVEHVVKNDNEKGDNRQNIKLRRIDPRYAYTLAMIRTLRAVVAVMRGEDPAPAIAELATVLDGAITRGCKKGEKCKVLVTTTNLRRAFAVVSALASYGASYRGDGSGDDAPEELQKQRAEERKKALETVIDAFTDRSQRKNEPVWSIGANVSLGLQGSHVGPIGEIFKDDKLNRNFVSLPMGLALQRLPGPNCWKPWNIVCLSNPHFMLTVIDLAQYLTVSKGEAEIQSPKPELATALRLGLEGGLLFGEPSFPISLTVHGAWIPRVTYEGSDETRGEFRYGVSVGVFVPFLDLN